MAEQPADLLEDLPDFLIAMWRGLTSMGEVRGRLEARWLVRNLWNDPGMVV